MRDSTDTASVGPRYQPRPTEAPCATQPCRSQHHTVADRRQALTTPQGYDQKKRPAPRAHGLAAPPGRWAPAPDQCRCQRNA
eukprot:6673302-Pyramimonas_sp.AAC.1